MAVIEINAKSKGVDENWHVEGTHGTNGRNYRLAKTT